VSLSTVGSFLWRGRGRRLVDGRECIGHDADRLVVIEDARGARAEIAQLSGADGPHQPGDSGEAEDDDRAEDEDVDEGHGHSLRTTLQPPARASEDTLPAARVPPPSFGRTGRETTPWELAPRLGYTVVIEISDMSHRILTGIKFFLGFAPRFSRKGFERRGLGEQPVEADFRDQRWLVTGASGGIGREIVAQAVSRGAGVTAVARSEARLQALKREFNGPVEIEVRAADLSLRREVVDLAVALAEEGGSFEVLINNVGVLLNEHVITDEGLETSFATNLLNHFVLTEELIARDLLARGSVVISMSSGGMYTTPLLPEQLNVTDPERHDGVAAYARHKRAQVELTHAWNRRHGPDVTFHVMHPGWVDTEGVKTSLPGFRLLFGPVLRTVGQGADTAIWLAAERPPMAEEGIWLDRELQPEHLGDHTRADDERRIELMEKLEGWRLTTSDGGTAKEPSPESPSSRL